MVKITLPNPNDYQNGDIEHFLRQLELCVHHARKSYQEFEKDETSGENIYVTFRFPELDLFNRETDKEGNISIHIDEALDKIQNIEIEISSL